MGRLPVVTTLVLGLSANLLSCDDGKKVQPLRRSDAIVASGNPKPAASPPAASSHKPRVPRTLCQGAPLERDFPAQQVGHGEAPGAESPGTQIRTGHGRWVWVNLWAAWCGPCKEEMPMLLSWQKQLQATTDFAFVSLDDDQRQFLRYLQQQPAEGLRSSFWLPEGKTRASWLTDLGVDTSPELPIQILVNPKGKVHCIIQGAVEKDDFPRVREMVSRR
ncbi:MAG: TlpA family protein disulfide reductase [Deltaproteobacteria bacterium HGW-Deltaproteobacteria-20]|jgi:thiol-disulfide isomerase/thioredoxin|nr:MAG: TlpA family protein disulfide reductase [Deltaproteobacteria bacterium HGW-Deltaproteobacteria-20]